MRLYLIENDNGEKEYFDVSILSFIKCTILSNLLMMAIFYGTLFILAFIFGMMSVLMF